MNMTCVCAKLVHQNITGEGRNVTAEFSAPYNESGLKS
jgi:hypothetical protein